MKYSSRCSKNKTAGFNEARQMNMKNTVFNSRAYLSLWSNDYRQHS